MPGLAFKRTSPVRDPITIPSSASAASVIQLKDWQSPSAIKHSLPVLLVTLISLSNGIANLYFVASHPHRLHRLLPAALPLSFFHYPRSFTLLIGFALIVSALNLWKRKRRAVQLVTALALLSFTIHLWRGYESGQATGFSIFVFVLLTLPLLVIGFLAFSRSGISISNLRDQHALCNEVTG